VLTFRCVTVSTVATCAVFGQAPGVSPRFEVADVHPSRVTAAQAARGPFMSGARYDLRNATLVDIIVKAYDVTPDKVVEGPSWLEYDRFDISATVPPKTSTAAAKLMRTGFGRPPLFSQRRAPEIGVFVNQVSVMLSRTSSRVRPSVPPAKTRAIIS